MATADYMDSKDENLLISIMKQDIECGARLLMSKYKEPIYWHIRRLVVSHDDAQDAAQETFVRIFRSFRQFKGDCSFKTWIYQIATHEALRLVERQRKEQISIDDPDSGSKELMAEEYVDYSDLEAVKLQKAILSLPAKQQLAFNLRYYDEMEYDEIARISGSTAANVKANYHIAKEKIIKYMNSTD